MNIRFICTPAESVTERGAAGARRERGPGRGGGSVPRASHQAFQFRDELTAFAGILISSVKPLTFAFTLTFC